MAAHSPPTVVNLGCAAAPLKAALLAVWRAGGC